MFVMCHENVLRLAAIDCSSPMSANTDRKTGSVESGSAGMCRPACAISASSPAVLIATVLPPVFGPVMSSAVVGGSITMSTGTGAGRQVVDVARRTATPRARISSGWRRGLERQPAVLGDRRRHAAGHLRQAGLRLEDVELARPPRSTARRSLGALAEAVGEREQDAVDLLGLLLLERHDLVVHLDGAERLHEQRGATRRAAVDDARDAAPVLGLARGSRSGRCAR